MARLPGGRHGLPREFVARNHRERLMIGFANAVAKHGYADTTITDITKEAAVSRRTFYEHFENKQELFIATYDAVLEQMSGRVRESFQDKETWPDRVSAGIAELLRFLASEPEFARLCMVESLIAGERVSARYQQAVDSFLPLLRAGRHSEISLPESTEAGLIGGMASLIARRVIAGQTEHLEEILPDLVRFVLAPYLGPAEAERFAARAAAAQSPP